MDEKSAPPSANEKVSTAPDSSSIKEISTPNIKVSAAPDNNSSIKQSFIRTATSTSSSAANDGDADDEREMAFDPRKVLKHKRKKENYVITDYTLTRNARARKDMNKFPFELHAEGARYNATLMPRPISKTQVQSIMYHHQHNTSQYGTLNYWAGVPGEVVSSWRQFWRPPSDATTEQDQQVPKEGNYGYYNSFEFAVHQAEENLKKWRANPKYKSEEKIAALMSKLKLDTPKMKIMEEKFQRVKAETEAEAKTIDASGLTERERKLQQRAQKLWPPGRKPHPLSRVTDRPIKLYPAGEDGGPLEELVEFSFMIEALVEAGMTEEDLLPKEYMDVVNGKKVAKPFTLNPYDPEFQKEEQSYKRKVEAFRRKEAQAKKEAEDNLEAAKEKERLEKLQGRFPRRRGPLTSAIEIPRAGKFSDGRPYYPPGYHEAIKKQKEEQRLLAKPEPKAPGEYFLNSGEMPEVDYDEVINKKNIVTIMRTVLPDYADIDETLLNRMQHSCAQFAAMVGSNAGVNAHIRTDKIFDGFKMDPVGGLEHYVKSKFIDLQKTAIKKEVAERDRLAKAQQKANVGAGAGGGTNTGGSSSSSSAMDVQSSVGSGGAYAGTATQSRDYNISIGASGQIQQGTTSTTGPTYRGEEQPYKEKRKYNSTKNSLAELQAKQREEARIRDAKSREEQEERRKNKIAQVNGPDVIEALETLGLHEYAEISQAMLRKWRGRRATEVTIEDAKKKKAEQYRDRMTLKGKFTNTTLPPGALIEASSSEWETASDDDEDSDNEPYTGVGTPPAGRKKKFDDMFKESPIAKPGEALEAMRVMKLKKGTVAIVQKRGERGPYKKKNKAKP